MTWLMLPLLKTFFFTWIVYLMHSHTLCLPIASTGWFIHSWRGIAIIWIKISIIIVIRVRIKFPFENKSKQTIKRKKKIYLKGMQVVSGDTNIFSWLCLLTPALLLPFISCQQFIVLFPNELVPFCASNISFTAEFICFRTQN